MIDTLSLEEKKRILSEGLERCMQNHTCGNYFDMSDIKGLENSDIEWWVNFDYFRLMAFTEDFGSFSMDYDFDYSFDCNLEEFYEQLVYFIYDNLENTIV